MVEMSAITVSPFESQIASYKEAVSSAKEQLLKTFAFVPDEKLTWSPSATARSPIQIVAHCGLANEAFATVIGGGELPVSGSAEEASAAIRAAGRDVTGRDEAVRMVEESTARVIAALDGVTPEMMETSPMSPFGPFPFVAWITLPGNHMAGHAHQIDYLETIWGDIEDHM